MVAREQGSEPDDASDAADRYPTTFTSRSNCARVVCSAVANARSNSDWPWLGPLPTTLLPSSLDGPSLLSCAWVGAPGPHSLGESRKNVPLTMVAGSEL